MRVERLLIVNHNFRVVTHSVKCLQERVEWDWSSVTEEGRCIISMLFRFSLPVPFECFDSICREIFPRLLSVLGTRREQRNRVCVFDTVVLLRDKHMTESQLLCVSYASMNTCYLGCINVGNITSIIATSVIIFNQNGDRNLKRPHKPTDFSRIFQLQVHVT